MKNTTKGALYALYARRLQQRLSGTNLPRHVAIVMDGNRRWARQAGFEDPRISHRYGAEHLDDVLQWCADIGIRYVTAFVASVDNVQKRDADEVGNLDILPDSTRHALDLAEEATRDNDTGFHLNIAIGYDGREEIITAIRCLLESEAGAGLTLEDIARRLNPEHIATHLYTSGQPDPDLVIRTSGERGMSGFLLWQAAYSELHFTDVYWAAFRKVDFLRALRSYAVRHRRFGA